MTRARFGRLVEQAIASLPARFRDHMRNVDVLVEDEPSDEQLESLGLDPGEDTLYGLYEGTPLDEREHNFAMTLPDRITLFYRPLVEDFPGDNEIRDEIRRTVVHEVAHFFGMDDDEIDDLGY